MALDYQTCRTWAPAGEEAPLQRILRNDIDIAYGRKTNPATGKKSLNRKAVARFEFFYTNFKSENLPNAVRAVDVIQRVNLETEQSCWLCGEGHLEGFLCRAPTDTSQREHYIGKDCAKLMVRYGLRAGVLSDAEKRGKIAVKQDLIRDLDDLVMDTKSPVSVIISSAPGGHDEDFVGTQYTWLVRNLATIPKKVREELRPALERFRDPYCRPDKTDLDLILRAAAEYRTFPAEAYEPIAQDVELMEKDGLAPAKTAWHLRQFDELTAAKAHELLEGIDHQGYRRRKNEETLGAYERNGVVLGALLNLLAPIVEHDRPHWAKVFKGKKVQDTILSESDYPIVAGCFNRWRFGYTSEVHGADSRALRERAIRLEPVGRFKDGVETLVAVGRKFEYALNATQSDAYHLLGEALNALTDIPADQQAAEFGKAGAKIVELRQEPLVMLGERCIPKEAFIDHTSERFQQDHAGLPLDHALNIIKKCVTEDKYVTEFRNTELACIEERAKHGIIRADDLPRLRRVIDRVSRFRRVL
ncbi:hypothetical protein HY493_04250 [Candidatus Woesearchaeota archaeon]|nr:hypothetical protein [Candidatus Woesearchaeota archaeon]